MCCSRAVTLSLSKWLHQHCRASTYLPILLVVSCVVIIRTLYTFFDLLWSGCMNCTALLNSSGSFSRYEVHFCTVNDRCRVSCLFTQSCHLLLRRYDETVAFAPLNSSLNIMYIYTHGNYMHAHDGGFQSSLSPWSSQIKIPITFTTIQYWCHTMNVRPDIEPCHVKC